jgi:hypothetical protein
MEDFGYFGDEQLLDPYNFALVDTFPVSRFEPEEEYPFDLEYDEYDEMRDY